MTSTETAANTEPSLAPVREVDFRKAVLDSKLPTSAKLAAIAYASYAQATTGTQIFPKREAVAPMVGVRQRQLSKIVDRLVSGGWLVVTGRKPKGIYVYRLAIPDRHSSATLHPPSPDTHSSAEVHSSTPLDVHSSATLIEETSEETTLVVSSSGSSPVVDVRVEGTSEAGSTPTHEATAPSDDPWDDDPFRDPFGTSDDVPTAGGSTPRQSAGQDGHADDLGTSGPPCGGGAEHDAFVRHVGSCFECDQITGAGDAA